MPQVNTGMLQLTVVDQGQVFNGTFHLSDLDMTALGSLQFPQKWPSTEVHMQHH